MMSNFIENVKGQWSERMMQEEYGLFLLENHCGFKDRDSKHFSTRLVIL